MEVKRGKIIVIEGTDGAGKGTQVDSLIYRAKLEKIPCTSFSFPRYDTPAGRGVKDYLMGEFGNPVKLPPKLSSAFYGIDRLVATPQIDGYLKQGINAFMNRYIGSNLAHQAAKLPMNKRKEFVEWCKNYEYNKLKISRPDLVLCLHVPADVSANSVVSRGLKKDGHESDIKYQHEVVKTYIWLAKTQPDWKLIECMKGKERKSIDEVTDELWSIVKPILTH